MPHAITCCPKCRTSFRVTSSQLESADGAVRCGSCLHVFDARAYFLNDASLNESHTDEPATSATDDGLDNDDFLISDDMDLPDLDPDIELDFPEDPNLEEGIDLGELTAEFQDSQVAKKQKIQDEQHQANPDSDNPDIDESWAHELLEELDADLAEADEDPAERLRREIDNRFDGRQTGSFDVLQEEFDADFDKFVSEAPIDDKPALDQDTGRFDLSDYRNTEFGDAIAKASSSGPPPTASQAYTITQSFEPVPLELTYHANNARTWLVRAGWLLANLALLLALVIQVGYLKFDDWSRIEPYRQYYAMACPVLGCSLPPQDAFDKIKISLVVRADPNNPEVLQADAILVNTAEFNQSFPPLALRFSDLNDNVVAERVFAPNEYLRGELANATELPPGQPVQLRLNLADPGESAVNYRAYIPAKP